MNFHAAADEAFSPDFLALLHRLGIDPRKPAELAHLGSSGEPMLTQGWFHFVGQILDGADAWHRSGEKTYVLELESFTGMQGIGFTSRLALVPDAFGDNSIVQLEFETTVPWVAATPAE